MKQQLLLLLALVLVLPACASKKAKLTEAIEWYYFKASTSSGGGARNPSEITILEIEEERVLAAVAGTQSNYSLPKPEDPNAFADTLWFRYEETNNGYRVTGIRVYTSQ